MKKILIADDEPQVLDVLKATLEMRGHSVVAVENGRRAIAAFIEAYDAGEYFDVLILDYMMPFVKGDEVIEAVRKYVKDETHAPHVAILTGSQAIETNSRIASLGLGQLFLKPVETFEKPNGFIALVSWIEQP